MAGPNSAPRFTYMHYNPGSAMSTLAGSLVHTPLLWPFLGVDFLTAENVADWIKTNTDRDSFFLEAALQPSLRDLEEFLRDVLGPVFEGGRSRNVVP
jgi:hypothetical protein